MSAVLFDMKSGYTVNASLIIEQCLDSQTRAKVIVVIIIITVHVLGPVEINIQTRTKQTKS